MSTPRMGEKEAKEEKEAKVAKVQKAAKVAKEETAKELVLNIVWGSWDVLAATGQDVPSPP